MVSALAWYSRTMRRADRLLQIIQILRRNRNPVSGEKIALECEVSLRTIYRDIETLMADRVPIRGEAGVGYILEDGYDLPPLMFKPDEIEAIILGLQWVKRRGDKELIRAADDSIAKIGAVLPKNLKPILFDTGLVVPPNSEIAKDNIDIAAIRRAIREQWKVEIEYLDENLSKSHRVIWPIAIAYFDKQRLIIAWCELRNDFRSFRTDRAKSLSITHERYKGNRKTLLSDYIAQIKLKYRIKNSQMKI